MKLTVLTDNNAIIDSYFLAEPGLSFLIQDESSQILFDTGYSNVFIKNALKLGEHLTGLDHIVFSHGHLDHTWGLDPLIKYFTELKINGIDHKVPEIIAHPETFISVACEEFEEFGSLFSEKKLKRHFNLNLSQKPVKINDRMIFLGEIPRESDFEGKTAFGRKEGSDQDDTVTEDSALVYQLDKGLVIITGCSHSGICNITEYAKKICDEERIIDIIGGFHLLNPSREQLDGTVDYMKNNNPKSIHACHCTDLKSKIALSANSNVQEVGVGMILEYC